MIENTVTVKSAESKPTKDGKKYYLSVTLVAENGNERPYAIFDPHLQEVIQRAYKEGLSLLVGTEKEGQFWNVKTAMLPGDTAKPVVAPQVTPKPQSGRTEKDDDILLAVAFKGAVELEGNLVPGAEPNVKRVLLTTAEILAGLILLRPRHSSKGARDA